MAKPKSKSKAIQKRGVPLWVWAVLLAGALLLAWALIQGGRQTPSARPLPDEVSVQEAAELRAQGAFLLDVREPDEWAAAHIPGATLIPLGELQSRIGEVPSDKTVLVYCRSGNRSASGRDLLRAAGYGNVTSLAGGIQQWAAAGFETVTGK